MSKAQVLVDQFHAAGEQYAQLRSSTNTQISGAVNVFIEGRFDEWQLWQSRRNFSRQPA
ncbi:hypothetical protein NE850_11925 [Paraburkholderia sp. USG1]|uniref:hypothetical protein n=1 Tax=Paraburkholderia sp. USG1 TaxID=2952268 RepID=UPI00285B5AB6|nr:hypothetical protein [Paraburkholderia sp. USG1]MDR8397048.1 hypothetical protein [Paraburkholderia sp. USG1]